MEPGGSGPFCFVLFFRSCNGVTDPLCQEAVGAADPVSRAGGSSAVITLGCRHSWGTEKNGDLSPGERPGTEAPPGRT